jgi:hypothetical protein
VKELPLFDDTAPISCTIEAADRAGRRELLEKMRSAAHSIERTDFGLVLSFSPDEQAVFKEFAKLEKQCCSFFGFAVESDSLRWEAPPNATEIMDALHRFFSNPAYPAERILV